MAPLSRSLRIAVLSILGRAPTRPEKPATSQFEGQDQLCGKREESLTGRVHSIRCAKDILHQDRDTVQDSPNLTSAPLPVALCGNVQSMWVDFADCMNLGVDLLNSGNVRLIIR